MKPLIWITLLLIISISGLSMFYNQDLYFKHLDAVHKDTTSPKEISIYLINYFLEPEYNPPMITEFTEQENDHLLDVKKRMCFIWYLVPLLLLLWVYLTYSTPTAPQDLAGGSAFSILLTTLAAILPFNFVFLIFHLILFPGGNWMFPQTSALIQAFPRPFWLLMASSLAYRILALSLITLILTFILNRLSKYATNIRKV